MKNLENKLETEKNYYSNLNLFQQLKDSAKRCWDTKKYCKRFLVITAPTITIASALVAYEIYERIIDMIVNYFK